MPNLPTLTLSTPAQVVIEITTAIVVIVILAWSIVRAMRPRKHVDVPVGKPVVDPNTPADTTSALSSSQPQSTMADVVERGALDTPTPAASVGSTPGTSRSVDGGEFIKLLPYQLDQIAVVAQALDNQWLSRGMVERMRRGFAHNPMGLADLKSERRSLGRGEYMRALLNSQQLVANRAFLYNTDYVAEDYIQSGETRSAFVELLNQGVIVPYLLEEHSPAEPPIGVDTTEALSEWQRVCREARIQSVRLDWDDTVNKSETKKLGGRFALWLHSLAIIQQYGDLGVLARQVGVSQEQIPAFQRRLRDVSHWAENQEGTVFRGAFYKEFITAPGTAVPDGVIDFDASRKPFASELKQLADLSYTTNLPDALGRYALTPMDSLPRTALQELNIKLDQQHHSLSEADINTLLQREAFSRMTEGLYLRSMAYLTLRDVIELRATDEWAAYIQELRSLLDHPLEFAHRSNVVSARYVKLAERMTDRVKARVRADLLERWSPVAKLVVTIGTSSVALWLNPFGRTAAGTILFDVSEGAVGQVANLTARLIIGGVADRNAEAELETSVDFLRGRVVGAQEAWKDIVGRLRSDPQFEDRSSQADYSRDTFDPNINYQETLEGIVYG